MVVMAEVGWVGNDNGVGLWVTMVVMAVVGGVVGKTIMGGVGGDGWIGGDGRGHEMSILTDNR